jgi:hypothetical protein
MANIPAEFDGVRVLTKANVYFDAKVISHSVMFGDGSKKTLGVIQPGRYHFNTDKAERMEIVAGQCEAQLDGQATTAKYKAGEFFDVPGKSGFTIEVSGGLCEYICSFLNS